MIEYKENANIKISPEDMLDSMDYMEDVSSNLSKYKYRLTGSKDETACAREIRDKLVNKNTKTRLEAYKAYPLLGRGVFPVMGAWFLLSFLLYFISFAGNAVAGVLLTLLALLTFMAGFVVLFLLYLGNDKLKTLLTSKISYNVVSEFEKNKDKNKKIIIITDSHDALYGSYTKDFKLYQTMALIATPITAIFFILFCILKMALGADTTAKAVSLSVIPAIFGIVGTAIVFLHYSPFEIHARENNGVATSLAMTTYKYFVENPDLISDNVKLVYASFGGENSGHEGSTSFIKAHPEYSKAKVICFGDLVSKDFSVVETDPIRKINYPTKMISIVKAAAHDLGYEIPTLPHNSFKEKFHAIHGFSANSFNLVGIDAVNIIAKDTYKEENHIDSDEKEKLFSITVSSISKLMMDYDPQHTEETKVDVEKLETASGLEVIDSKGK